MVYSIQVGRQVICQVSAVWRAMSSPGSVWEESRASTVSFPEDEPEAMLLLLRIAHLQFYDVPTKQLDDDRLHNIALMCDKYDCLQLTRPWLRQWIRKTTFSERHISPITPRRLFIYWTFGMRFEFLVAVSRIILETRQTNRNGETTLKLDGTSIERDVWPAGTLGELGTPIVTT
jgi:hypothetical protein